MVKARSYYCAGKNHQCRRSTGVSPIQHMLTPARILCCFASPVQLRSTHSTYHFQIFIEGLRAQILKLNHLQILTSANPHIPPTHLNTLLIKTGFEIPFCNAIFTTRKVAHKAQVF
jgi:hypothetical protein